MATYIHLKVTTTTEHHELADAPFRVGDWLVEPRLNRLSRGEESIQIELKMMDVLVCLAERAGELVTRREITDTVWATEFITEKTLTRAVAELRRTFGDDAKHPRYIETIHRKGYRLIAPAEVVRATHRDGHSLSPRAWSSTRMTATHTRVWPPSPRTTPSSSSAARPRWRSCGARSPLGACSP